MGWSGPILTDSGGFQVLSLRSRCVVDEAGATFRSHFDGSEWLLTPEVSMEIQAMLGSDIAMVLDVCPPYPCPPQVVRDATERTVRWAQRSLSAPHAAGQAVFGILQGGTDQELRAEAATAIRELPFDGYGIGGLSVGEPRDLTWPALSASIANLPDDRPRYLMGVGAPNDVIEAISHGIDLFDCVLPTRLGRTGTVFTSQGELDLRQSRFALCEDPIDPECDCQACVQFSLGYLHHLFQAGEDLGMRLASLHNLRFLVRLVADAGEAIGDGRYERWLVERERCTDSGRLVAPT
jgi:queuine tRNA-ribosyltransferase